MAWRTCHVVVYQESFSLDIRLLKKLFQISCLLSFGMLHDGNDNDCKWSPDKPFLMSPQLEVSVAKMACCLKSLFRVLFCTSQGEPSISEQLLATFSQIKELLQTRLADYEDYLLVKGRRNMTMTAYPFATSSNAQSRFLSFGLQASNLSCGQ